MIFPLNHTETDFKSLVNVQNVLDAFSGMNTSETFST